MKHTQILNEYGGITTDEYWDCECHHYFIRPASKESCLICGSWREYSLDSRINEVIDSGLKTRYAKAKGGIMKDTNLPYVMVDEGFEDYLDGIKSRYTIQGHDEDIIAYCFTEDRARFIVKACNSYGDMLEALEFIMDKCTLYGPADSARNKARAAIAKAKGEQ